MGQVIELHRYRRPDRVAFARAPHGDPHLLPFLWWRSTSALWLSLWLAPLGLRVVEADGSRGGGPVEGGVMPEPMD